MVMIQERGELATKKGGPKAACGVNLPKFG
jgi:hypothetical protein